MKSSPQDDILFNEAGVTVSLKQLKVGDRAFKWGDLSFVNISRGKKSLLNLFSSKPPTCFLMLSTKTNPIMTSVFQTDDPALVERLQKAINEVARRRGATRDL